MQPINDKHLFGREIHRFANAIHRFVNVHKVDIFTESYLFNSHVVPFDVHSNYIDNNALMCIA